MTKEFTTQAGRFLQAEKERQAAAKEQEGEKTKPKQKDTAAQKQEVNHTQIPTGYELKPESKTKRVNLLLRPTIYEIAKKKAEAKGISFNDYVNNLLQEDISK